MDEKLSTYDERFHGGRFEGYKNSMLQYTQLGKTDMHVSHMSLGGAAFGKYDYMPYLTACHLNIYSIKKLVDNINTFKSIFGR